jgi:hypothetical protein
MTNFGLRNNVFSMGDSFTTANRYPRQVANPIDTVMTMVEGPSIAITAAQQGKNGMDIRWRYECGSLTFTNAAPGQLVNFAIDRPIAV